MASEAALRQNLGFTDPAAYSIELMRAIAKTHPANRLERSKVEDILGGILAYNDYGGCSGMISHFDRKIVWIRHGESIDWYILLNKTSGGDQQVGSGSTKIVTNAVHVNSGTIVVSASIRNYKPNGEGGYRLLYSHRTLLEECTLYEKMSSNPHCVTALGCSTVYPSKKVASGQKIRIFMPKAQNDLHHTNFAFALFETKISVAWEVLKGIEAVRLKDHIYRDIKASNYLLFGDLKERRHEVRLTDFGLAISKGYRYTSFGTTLDYFSPEMAAAYKKQDYISSHPSYAEVDLLQAEVWSLGAVLYRIFLNMSLIDYSDRTSTVDEILDFKSNFFLRRAQESGWLQIYKERASKEGKLLIDEVFQTINLMLEPDPSKRLVLEECLERFSGYLRRSRT